MKLKLNRLNYGFYFDSGHLYPYDEEELIKFCIENFDKFYNEGPQEYNICDICNEPGLNNTYTYRFFDDENKYDLIAKYMSDMPTFGEHDIDYSTIVIIFCDTCNKWFVTV